MPLDEPVFDSRSYREILNEALARIPTHNPEWTNFNDSDPGITLLQLFAFMTESIIYRANRIPQRNRRKFLKLLNIGLRGADAAQGLVSFANPQGPATAVTLDSNIALSAGDIAYRTDNGLDVLPVEYRLYYKAPIAESRKAEIREIYDNLYASFDLVHTSLDFYETRPFSLPQSGAALPSLDIAGETVDGSLWIAILRRGPDTVETAREALNGKTLTLGVVPALSESGSVLYPRRVSAINDGPSLIFEIPNAETNVARYQRLQPRNGHDLLASPGIVELTLPSFISGDAEDGRSKLGYWDSLEPLETGVGDFPPSLEDTDDQDRLVTWIRMRSPETSAVTETQDESIVSPAGSRQVRSPISWVGINVAKVQQRAEANNEQLPRGTGEPDQTARLSNTSVLVHSVQLRVNGELWERIDDLDTAGPEVETSAPRFSSQTAINSLRAPVKVDVYSVDRESGEIRFGNGLRGKRPPKGANIQASYAYGGGRRGSVGIAVINKHNAPQTALKVSNPVPTWGGVDSESVAQAEARMPSVIRHRNRLVTLEDYREIVENAPGVNLGRVDVLPIVHPRQPLQDSHGVVTLMVIPAQDPLHPAAPQPDNVFLKSLCSYLEPRRVLTTELHIIGPEYKNLWVSLSVEVIPGFDTAPVVEAVRNAVVTFLSPLHGGFKATGWPLNKAVEAGEISAFASRVEGVAKINEIYIGDSSGTLAIDFSVVGLELPRLAGLAVVTGVAPRIEEIQASEPVEIDPSSGVQVIPVPVIPEEC